MDDKILRVKMNEYASYLKTEERSENTIAKYTRDLRAFLMFAEGQQVDKETLMEWKESLAQRYAPSSVNSMLAAVNGFFDWLELPQYKVKPLKIQRAIFTQPERDLTRTEYGRLVQLAQNTKRTRLALVLQTICSTGIRVSELRFITVAAIQTGRASVDCKGKKRTVFLPKELCQSLRRYCQRLRITDGVVFRTAHGTPLDRSNIWRDMKMLCKNAGIEQSKVFPHNLRHLFAKTYYMLEKDLSKLADLLGHTSVDTTRIYTMESGAKHVRQLERMGLVLEQKN